jgi:6-phospho-beta-glucosidase
MGGIKLVVIGGGSSYTPELADGLINRRDSFPVKELVLVDIESGRKKAETICALIGRMFGKAGLQTGISCSFDRKEALRGADFVVSQLRVGGLAARSKDERVPLKYGAIGQETTGPGGFAKALRTIPVMLDICRDMEEACPEAWLINFTNPSGMITEAVHKHSKVNCIGLCNIPINMERAVCGFLGADRSRVNCSFAGLNHLSFIGRLRLDGRDVLKDLSGTSAAAGVPVKNIPGIDLPAGFAAILGVIPSPYLKYYYLERQMFREEREKFDTTGKTRADEVMEVEKRLFEIYADASLYTKPAELSGRGGALYSEAAVALMDSLWNNRSDVQVVNTVNGSCIPELPADSVIETNCVVTRGGAVPLVYGPLPAALRGLIQQAKAYEQLTIEAAVGGDRDRALLALLNNPLVHDLSAAENILKDILEEHAEYLPAFRKRG